MTSKKILLIQSAQTQTNGTKRSLEDRGYKVIWAGSGLTALMMVRKNTIDLILLDVALPDIEGLDLCRRFRTWRDASSIPVILLTSRGYAPERTAGTPYGPDDYLAKPYSDDELDDKIAAVLARTTEKAPAVRLKPQAAPNPEQKPDNLESPLLPFRGTGNAVVDPATGLFGRPQFEAMFSKEFKRSQRFRQPMSCMLINLDGQKMGRKADESLVKAVIELVQKTIREVDTAAWWSGEAIIVLLPNTVQNDAVQAAARVLDAVAIHPFTWPDAMKVTMSIGVSGLPDEKIDSGQKMIETADAACRRAQEFAAPPLHLMRIRS